MNDFLRWLTDPLAYPFMVRGLLASLMVGLVCAVLGAYIVLRGMAFFGDALAHMILPGVVVAYLAGWPLTVGALAAGILTAVGIGALSSRIQIKEDTAIGVLFAAAFALGVALLSTTRSHATGLTEILFGNVLGVSNGDLIWITVLSALVLLTIFLFYKEFLVLSFDPVLAATLRLPTGFLRYLLLILTAVAVVISLQTVGLALMVAMLVTPAASAYLLTRRLPMLMAVSALIGIFSSLTGLYLSYHWNIASGPAVVLTATAVFAVAALLSPRRRARQSAHSG